MDNKLTQYIAENSQKRNKKLKYDFMPSMLEIIEKPSHIAGTVIVLTITILLISAIVWACFSKLDVVVSGSGSIQPVGDVKIIQSYSAGIVTDINVNEGEYVNKGDILIKLDTQSLEIDKNQLDKQKLIAEKQLEIYNKIKNGEDVSTIVLSDYDIAIQPYIQAIIDGDKSYKNSISNLEKEKINAELNLQIGEIQLDEYERNGTNNQEKSQELVNQQYQLQIDSAILQIDDTKVQYSANVNAKISEISQNLVDINSQLEKYDLSVKYQNITAPVSGYIGNISVKNNGAAVSAAQEILTIVPDNTPLEMTCYVKNMDIADISIGMKTTLKLEAYPYNKYGTVEGIVKYISPTAFSSESLGSVYLVKVEITDKNDKVEIIPGLSGVAEIKTGTRRVIDYFLAPIKKGFGESLREE